MITENTDAPKEYKEAFMKFSDALESEFSIKQKAGALVLYGNMTYWVCHYNDLVRDFKSHFDYNFTFIYIETPFDLWRTMFDLRKPTDLEDLVIDFYNA